MDMDMIEKLSLTAEVRVGTLTLTLEELLALEPGTRLEFVCDCSTPILIVVGEETLAQARFVQDKEHTYLEIEAVPDCQEDQQEHATKFPSETNT